MKLATKSGTKNPLKNSNKLFFTITKKLNPNNFRKVNYPKPATKYWIFGNRSKI